MHVTEIGHPLDWYSHERKHVVVFPPTAVCRDESSHLPFEPMAAIALELLVEITLEGFFVRVADIGASDEGNDGSALNKAHLTHSLPRNDWRAAFVGSGDRRTPAMWNV